MATKVNKPSFSERSTLVRYVSEENRLKGKRPAVATFLPDPPSDTPEKDYLSVNSLEVESITTIAIYHRQKWQSDNGKVALTVHKVFEYSNAGKKCGVNLNYNRAAAQWKFRHGAKEEDAYKHHPVIGSHLPLNSKSHSGVEFVRAMNEYSADKFARRMVGKRFHLL
jgi:hypothetical protein